MYMDIPSFSGEVCFFLFCSNNEQPPIEQDSEEEKNTESHWYRLSEIVIISEKIIRNDTFRRCRALILRRRFEDGETSIEIFVQLKNGSDIPAAIAIVRRGPNRQDRFVEVPFIAFHDQLMRSTNQINIIGLIELRNDITAKQITSTARTDTPA